MAAEHTLTVSEVLHVVDTALLGELPGPIWVRGEVTGLRRTPRGALFFRLADAEVDGMVLEVMGRGIVMEEVERVLTAAGVGNLRNGIEIRVNGTVGLAKAQSLVRLSMLAVDPEFTAGRLAMDRDRVLRMLAADGSLEANRQLDLPIVPLRIGLVTSRGSAAHADFLHQLATSEFRYQVKTAHTSVQGEGAHISIVTAMRRAAVEELDMLALIRGGGAKLDLAAFDTETVGRAVAAMDVPVITGIGHEIDDTVADRAAAVSTKTPSAAGEWLVSRVGEFATRVETARGAIREQAMASMQRAGRQMSGVATGLAGARASIDRRRDMLRHQADALSSSAKTALAAHRSLVGGLEDFFATVGVESTLGRGFALVTDATSGSVIRSKTETAPGAVLIVRFADGTVPVTVDEP